MESLKANHNKEKINIMRETAIFSAASYVSQAILMIRGFIIASVLGPTLYGTWSIYRTLVNSAHFLSLGTTSAMVRQVPLEEGKGNKDAKIELQQSALTWNILASGFVTIILVVMAFSPVTKNNGTRLEFILLSIAFFLNAFKIFIPFKLNSEQKIIEMSKFDIAYAVLNTVFGLSLLWAYQVNGLLLALVMTNIVLIIIMIIKGELVLVLNFNFTLIKKMISIGLPILLLYMSYFAMGNIDKFIVYFLLGKTMTGYYGLAAFISGMIHYIPHGMFAVLMPRMMQAYGRTGNSKELQRYFMPPLLILASLLPIVLGVIFICINAVILYILPQYLPALSVLRILMVGLFFSALLRVPTNILIALNKQLILLVMMLVLLILGAVADVVLIKMGYGIVGVALATVGIFFISALVANVYVLREIGNGWKETLTTMWKLHFPLFYVAIGIYFIMGNISLNTVIATDLIRVFAFSIYVLPIIFHINKNFKIFGKSGLLFNHKSARDIDVSSKASLSDETVIDED